MEKSRFSMLLLEPSEIYFEDYSCRMQYSEDTSPVEVLKGRLKLCSKSLVFEPGDWNHPLIKLPFKETVEISIVKMATEKNVIKARVNQYTEMLKENVLAPYTFIYEKKQFFFLLDFADAEESSHKMLQLLRASTLHAPEHNSMVATILHSRYTRMVFDTVMMDDYTEEILCEMQAEKISPLIKHQGKLALTPTTLYFQLFNNIENVPILKIKLCNLKRIYKRRFLLRHVGLEIYCKEGTDVPHIYLSFQSEQQRNSLYDRLEQSPNVKLDNIVFEEMTMQWQNGIVSNYDYLVYLNCLADRSKNDLTQYPVFPWVVADYKSDILNLEDAETFRDLSKPMGALNKERLDRLLERYNEMTEHKFLYGSHYSAPGLVLFYLVRKYPHYMLCLQNGRFDHPDRMFNSTADVYKNCLKNMSDFKELIPEFYNTENKGDFLMNKCNINFGERHDGSKVDNVSLPPWATNAEDFVLKLREALESDFVSRHLHLWIDLIFGYKQRGEEAVKANNVFYHLCYEGSVDLESVSDMNDRHALEVQIMEFGQVPKQLFVRPHVRKITHQIPNSIPNNIDTKSYSLKCIDTISLHRETVTCALLHKGRVVSVGKDGTLKVYDKEKRKQIRSVILCSTPLSCCVMVDDEFVAVGSWNNQIYLYNIEYGRVVEDFRAHEDSVSCLLWLEKESLLISGGLDGVARVWADVRTTRPALRWLKCELDHDGKVTALTYRRRLHHYAMGVDLITGTSDGEILIWNLSTRDLINRITAHSSPVTAACFMINTDRVVTVSGNEMVVTDLSVMHCVYQKSVCCELQCACAGGGAAWAGGGGGLHRWDLRAVSHSHYDAHTDTINSIFVDDSDVIVTASADRTVKLWELTPDS